MTTGAVTREPSCASVQRDHGSERGVLLILAPRRAHRLPKRRDRLPQAAHRSRECSFGVLIQLFLGYLEESQAGRSGGTSKRVAEEHSLSFVHPEMHGKDLVDAPIRHGIDHEDRAGGYIVSRFACA